MEDAVINVANTAGKAVVSISAERTTKVSTGRRFVYRSPFGESPFGEDEFFRKFFDDFFGQMPEREYKQFGLGSGVIVDPQGYILTNEHVIDGADKIKVTLPDGREFKAELKGEDPRADLAIIKINAHNLPAAAWGDSDNLRIGQWVVAIGNPFGFALQNPEPTVTAGVISALHRSIGKSVGRDRDYNDLIQTDAAINPGNSGGPLVNLKGEIVGINVAIFTTSGGYQGIGFAIPSNAAKRIMSNLIQGKKIL
jgi:serine protease Do